MGDDNTPEDALTLLDKWLPDASEKLKSVVMCSAPVPTGDPRLSHATTHVIAAPSASLLAAQEQAARAGLSVRILGDALEGEARELGEAHAQEAMRLQSGLTPDAAPLLLLSGGECTVTRRGNGIGGPNAEYALSAAQTLNGSAGISLIACDTDGVDGAAEIAGAFVGPDTLLRGGDPQKALKDNDAHSYFTRIGDSIVTGPTLTNVNDFRAFLVHAPDRQRRT